MACFELSATEDRGLSLTAAHRIPAGTLIFSEPPLIKIPLADEGRSSAIEDVFEKLSKSECKQYLKLFNAKSSRTSEVAGIYSSNCYDIKSFNEDGGSCVGAISSRLNHSCVPNVCFSYLPPTQLSETLLVGMSPTDATVALRRGLMQFRAIKTISKGKELVSNYEKSIFAPRGTRLARLRRHYGFDCTCEACTPVSDFWERSDSRRKRMEECIKIGAQMEKQWAKVIEKEDIPTVSTYEEPTTLCKVAITVLLELETLLTKEGLHYTPLANCYKSLAKWSTRINADAIPWMQQELEVVIRCSGRESSRCRALLRGIKEAREPRV